MSRSRIRALRVLAASAVVLSQLTLVTVAEAVKDATVLVSRTSAGVKGAATSAAPAISADGRYIAFESDAQLVAEDTDLIRDIYVRDLETPTTILVSRATTASGAKGTAAATAPSISADGQRVAFQTTAKLDADDADSALDVYVRDLGTATTLFASRPTGATGAESNQASSAAAISGDGRYVAFGSDAKLHDDDTDALIADVYRRDLQTQTTELVSRPGVMGGSEGAADLPAISADGRVVSFQSSASNLTADDPDTTRDVFVRDLQAATTTLASRATTATGTKGDSFSQNSSLSADGRYVAFDSQATLDPADSGGTPDVYVRDLQASTTTLVSRATDAPGLPGAKANALAVGPAISDDGRFVAFESAATNLGDDTPDSGARDVFERDLNAATTVLVSRASGPAGGPGGAPANNTAVAAGISSAGRFVAFDSTATNLDGDDTDPTRDVFARDVLGPPDTTDPQIAVPADITVQATGPSGAVVSYNVVVTDDVAVASSGCVPPPGATFPIGATTVTCTATDTSDNRAEVMFVVTVADTIAPAITVPADIVVPATGPDGAAVSYTASASDAAGDATIACTPPSGATFAIGATTVACSASDAAGNHSDAMFGVTVQPLPSGGTPPPPAAPPPAAPPPPPPGGGLATASRSPAKLSLQRAAIIRASRMLDIVAPISTHASGRIAVELRCAGRRLRFTAPIDSAKGRIRIRRRIPRAQASAGTCILMLAYAGDPDTRPQTVRLRAAPRPAALTLKRPTLVNGRLRASGTVARRARGIVRVQLEYDYDGETRSLAFSARIVRGAWKLDEKLTGAVLAEIAARTGTVHSYTLYTGYLPLKIRGEMKSSQVLGER